MDSFYLTILSIATIILILALTYVGILLYGTKSSEVFPPVKNACPDYWVLRDDGRCEYPPEEMSSNRGNLSAKEATEKWRVDEPRFLGTDIIEIDNANKRTIFNMDSKSWNNIYGKKDALCNQKYWAYANKISWDGVSNTNQC